MIFKRLEKGLQPKFWHNALDAIKDENKYRRVSLLERRAIALARAGLQELDDYVTDFARWLAGLLFAMTRGTQPGITRAAALNCLSCLCQSIDPTITFNLGRQRNEL